MSRVAILKQKDISLALALALKAARMSQSELARRVGCGPAAISAYLHGREVPRRERLAKINEVLGADLVVGRAIRVKDVAPAMGMCEHTLRRAMLKGRYEELGVVIPSRGGKRYCFRFYPLAMKKLAGIS